MPFQRLVRELAQLMGTGTSDFRWRPSAIEALQYAAEDYLVSRTPLLFLKFLRIYSVLAIQICPHSRICRLLEQIRATATSCCKGICVICSVCRVTSLVCTSCAEDGRSCAVLPDIPRGDALQIGIFEDSNLAAIHAKRVTIMPKVRHDAPPVLDRRSF